MQMETCVIFGAGGIGVWIYRVLVRLFDVKAYFDNNPNLWGRELNGIKILPPSELPDVVNASGAQIFIANQDHYREIGEQVIAMGFTPYRCDGSSFYECVRGFWSPMSLRRGVLPVFKKERADDFTVLFTQRKACTRTVKIAAALKSIGVKPYLAYTQGGADEAGAFLEETHIFTYGAMLEYVNTGEFDIIHCSNEPDELINVLLHSNKKVIHDCHDAITIAHKTHTPAEAALEYIANTQADGVIYPSEAYADVMVHRYHPDRDKTFVLENLSLDTFETVKRLPKLSAEDGVLHCVFEGHIVDESKEGIAPHRFMGRVWDKITTAGVHVHIFTHRVPEYCEALEKKNRFYHYEGNYTGAALTERMTAYDVGLVVYGEGSNYMNIISPNKIYEYAAAGLPVCSNYDYLAGVAERLGIGGKLDFGGDIKGQLESIAKIEVPDGFLTARGLTMNAHAERLLKFYKEVIAR